MTSKHDVFSITYSPDGTCVASGHWDSVISVWDTTNGDLLREFHLDVDVTLLVKSVTYSPDGVHIISSISCTIYILDAFSGAQLKTLKRHSGYINSVACHPDGKKVVSASSDNTIRIWDFNHTSTTYKQGHLLELISEEAGNFKCIAVCPTCIAVGFESDITYWRFDLWYANGTHKATIKSG